MDDRTVRSEIARQASVSERTASRALARLHDLGAIEWQPSRARGQLGLLSLKRETDRCPGCAVENDRTRDIRGDDPGQVDVPNAGQIDGPLPPISSTYSNQPPRVEIALTRDAIASRLVDNIEGHSYDEWLEYIERLRAENVGDLVIDMAAGQTITRVLSGHVHAPRGYFMKTARDWYEQRTGAVAS
jgi:hypothetical protein